ncbi:MAG: AAA family ATPase [Anaerolineae bacterium]
MIYGNIILLNGASSAGKSSIVKALQNLLEEPYLEAGIDKFLFMLPKAYLNQAALWHQVIGYEKDESGALLPKVGPRGHQLMSGMHHAIAGMARQGNHVIADHVLLHPSWLDEWLNVWHELRVLFVGIYCPPDILEQRERDRKDRTIGQARGQAKVVHQNCEYDLLLDTSMLSTDECAAQILQCLQEGKLSAFENMRQNRLTSGP